MISDHDPADNHRDSESLQEALHHLPRQLEPPQVELLDRYRQLLWDFNLRINLTRHTTFDKFVTRDLVDSTELSDFVDPSARVLDVGSGGGVPGIVLAVLRPDLSVSLCESVGKKVQVLRSIVQQLQLPIEVYHSRAEDILESKTFDKLVARAIAPLPRVLSWLAPHWGAFDELLLIKGRSWIDERAEARRQGLLGPLELRRAATYTTPLSGHENVILRIWHPGSLRD